jgi:tetratricopeptide (TPR) repeat protein
LELAIDKHCRFGREVTALQGLFFVLCLCLITMIGLGLLPSVFAFAKAEKDIVVPGNVTTLYYKGLALYYLGNYTGAIVYFDKALGIDPKLIAALGNTGLALDALGNYTGAILYYDKVLAIDPTDVHALTDKGAALRDLGNYTDAIKYYDKALSIDPKHATRKGSTKS